MKHLSFFQSLFAVPVFLSLLVIGGAVSAFEAAPWGGRLDFIANMGQWESNIRYKINRPQGAVLFTAEGMVYHYAEIPEYPETDTGLIRSGFQPVSTRHHAYSVTFKGANQNAVYLTEERRSYYHNYIIGNDSNLWKGHVPLFGRIRRNGIYKGIDFTVYQQEGKLKYDLVVQPGADPAQIVLSYKGVQPKLNANGTLTLSTTVGKVTEEAPYVYQVIAGKKVTVPCRYQLSGEELRYDFPEAYNKAYPLVIDPAIVFSTYSGNASAIHESSCTAYDTTGNLYTAAISYSFGWPLTTGAFQTSVNYYDAVIAKYNAAGSSLLYATYFGGVGYWGNGVEYPHALRINKAQEMVLVGSTTSSDMPVTPGCYQSFLKPGGHNSTQGMDLFVTHFTADGSSLIGSTFIGGHHTEALIAIGNVDMYVPKSAAAEVIFDDADNIWVVSGSFSDDFPTTANAIQTGTNNTSFGGEVNGVLFKMNPGCTQLLYSTYLGGTGSTVLHDIIFNNTGKIIVSGTTGCADFPVTPGAAQPNFLGGPLYQHTDGVVCIVDPATGALLRSTYVGTGGRDMAMYVRVNRKNEIYIACRSSGIYPASSGAMAINNGDIFLVKYNDNLTAILRSARMGNAMGGGAYRNFQPTEFMVDDCSNIYLSGFDADMNQPVTANAFQQQPRSYWLGVVKPDFSGLRFGTYYGTPPIQRDFIGSGRHRSDPKGIIYQSALTRQNFPVTPGSFATSSAIQQNDIACFKFDLSQYADDDTVTGSQTVLACFRDSVRLDASLPGLTNYQWGTGATGPAWWSRESGTYVLTYKTGESCGLHADTFLVTITPLPDITVKESCFGENDGGADAMVEADNNIMYRYTWRKDTATLRVAQSHDGDAVTRLDPGDYVLQIQTNAGCDTSITFRVEELPPVVIQAGSDTTVTGKQRFRLWATGALQYSWEPPQWLDDPYSRDPLCSPEGPVTYTVTGRNQFGCRASGEVHINVESRYFIPNAFSPNGDGLNDVFSIANLGFERIQEFRIFNRFGENVFFTMNVEDGWDGYYKGKPADVGTYFYYIRLTEVSGRKIAYKGDLTLTR